MMKTVISAAMLGILLAGSSLPAIADREGRHMERHGRIGHWEGHDIRRFHERDFHVWRGGNWHHGRHGGRLGWWWVVGGIWYFYPSPIYPYPDPYTPPVTVIEQQQPPVVVAPQTDVQVQPQQPAQVWYYCDAAKGYYPYVPSCPSGWRTVPATPDQGAPH
jgi:hypothetical protein